MFTCKKVSKSLSNEDYEKLSPMRKFFLKLHVKLCFICGKFNRQIMDSQDMCRCFKDRQKAGDITAPQLEDTQKEALKALLAKQSHSKAE